MKKKNEKRFYEKIGIWEISLLSLLIIIVIPTVFLIIFCSLTWFYVGSILSTSIAGIYLMLKSIAKQRKIDIHNAILFNEKKYITEEKLGEYRFNSYEKYINDKYRIAHLDFRKLPDGEQYDYLYKIYYDDYKNNKKRKNKNS